MAKSGLTHMSDTHAFREFESHHFNQYSTNSKHSFISTIPGTQRRVVLSIPDAMVSVPRLHRGCWGFESLGIDQSHSSNIAEQRENRAGNGAGLVSQKPENIACSSFLGRQVTA